MIVTQNAFVNGMFDILVSVIKNVDNLNYMNHSFFFFCS